MEDVEDTSKVLYNFVRILDIPPFLQILSYMIDFLSHYKFILRIITFCINESTACVNLACKAIFEFSPLDCACTKMSKTLQSYKTYSIFLHHLFKTCFKQEVFMRKNFKKWLFITSDLKSKKISVVKNIARHSK